MALGIPNIVSYDWCVSGLAKMNHDKFSLSLPFDCEIVLALFSLKLVSEGFHVDSSFELESACAPFTETACPHTGQSPCDCHLVTLFAYEQNGPSIPLVFHGHAGQTEISIASTIKQTDADLIRRIRMILEKESDTIMELNE